MKQHLVELCIVLAVRIGFGGLVRTTFVPDEYYQHIDPAYRLVYGDEASIQPTWEWQEPHRIRSYVLLLPYIAYFGVLRVLGLSSPMLARQGCRIVQGLLSGVGDMAQFLYVGKMFRGVYAGSQWLSPQHIVLMIQLGSWSSLYCGSRTLANSTEMAGISLIVLVHSLGRASAAAVLSSVLVCARPSAALFLGPYLIAHVGLTPVGLLGLLKTWAPPSLLAALFCTAWDSLCYGQFTITALRFLQVNILQNVAASFGRKPWHWNWTSGLPTMLGLQVPAVLVGLWLMLAHLKHPHGGKQRKRSAHPAAPACIAAMVYAALLQLATPHQELRFLLPCLPGLHLAAGLAWWHFLHGDDQSRPRPRPRLRLRLRQSQGQGYGRRRVQIWWTLCLFLITAIHVVAAVYLSTRHQAGAEAAMAHLADHTLPSLVQLRNASRGPDAPDSSSSAITVVQLAPCFSFPPAMFLHPASPRLNSRLRLLAPTCSPASLSDADPGQALFLQSPAAYLRHLSVLHGTPDAVVTFDSYAGPEVRLVLSSMGLHLEQEFAHSDMRYDYDDPQHSSRALLFVLSVP